VCALLLLLLLPLQELLERCLLLADKYDMACLLQRLAGRLSEPSSAYSTDPSQPNFALRCGTDTTSTQRQQHCAPGSASASHRACVAAGAVLPDRPCLPQLVRRCTQSQDAIPHILSPFGH
jgi:hypothetical protein